MGRSVTMEPIHAFSFLDTNGESTVRHSGCEILFAKGWIKDDKKNAKSQFIIVCPPIDVT